MNSFVLEEDGCVDRVDSIGPILVVGSRDIT
jgi:hypothetical protein